jgi:HSP20 family protein
MAMPDEHDAWMWERARSIVDRADRLQRRFFQLSQGTGGRVTWEPPVDVFRTATELWVLVALPGVEAQAVEVGLEGGTLIVAGERNLPEAFRSAHVHRLEIPYGRFERRIPLPVGRYAGPVRQVADGCLVLRFRILD